MSTDLTFKSVCDVIKKKGKEDPKLLEAVDSLIGLALVCSPLVLGPVAMAALPVLGVKNELTKIGKSVFEKLTKSKDEEYLSRYETMHAAYGLLVFTSFFDALDASIPKALRDQIKLLDPEKVFLAREGVDKSSGDGESQSACNAEHTPVSTYSLPFPHPTETLADQSSRHKKLWAQMAQGFLGLVQKLAFWEEANDKKRATLLGGLSKIEEAAAVRFEAQYFELARKFEDFAVWANLQAHRDAKALIGQMSEFVREHAALSATSHKAIDIGFSSLREVVLKMPQTLQLEQAEDIAQSFEKHYQARINEPIIEAKDIGDDSGPRLSFPKICEAFVPQAFKVLRQDTSRSRRLEDEATWNDLPRRGDLGAFLLSYLTSPYSTDAPLLILGHPGSGKSLLTTILSAQLMSKQFTAIRVPLREVNADADIQTQIEEFIKRISGVSFDSWIKLRSQFKNCPPVVILDGYDELLQASGQVFASYVMDAQRFQQHQSEQGWPVRIIITSRVTLIDKAAVPVGAAIVRLLEFDEDQRARWSAIWNTANAGYFLEAKIRKFELPSRNDQGAEKILNLAEQPLLLLMLALYDSQSNQLATSKGLDRTKLYDSLLRRFVTRERGKEKGFVDTNAKEREKALATEMQRIGVAALGMYNRRKVHILSAELDDDLAFFKLEREVIAMSGKALSQADLLLGSFFFVHKSKAQHSSGAEETHEESSAFEFLHNTFGEFLTADFVIRRAVAQVQALRAAEANEALRPLMDKMLGTADGFERDWFASLVYTPLFTRPVILEMIREWAPHVLKEHNLLETEFVETLDRIILNQAKRLLSKREMPQIMRKETAQEGYRVPFGDHPLVGHIAIYSINLILLRLVSGREPFLFDESEIASHEDGTRPWDRLMNIWRSWFSLENLNGLTAVMVANRCGKKIKVAATDKFLAQETTGKLQEVYNVALSLGDDVSACIAGFHLFDPTTESSDDLAKLERMVEAEGLDLGFPAMLARLQVLARTIDDSPEQFAKFSKFALQQTMRKNRRDQIESICQLVARVLEKERCYDTRDMEPDRVFPDILEPRFLVDIARHDVKSARRLFAVGKQITTTEWAAEFSHRFLEFFTNDRPGLQTSLQSFDYGDFSELLLLIRDAGFLFRYNVGRGIALKNFDLLLDHRKLLTVSKRDPQGAVAYLQILRELGGEELMKELFSRRIDRAEFINHLVNPRSLLDMCERNPEAALSFLQILRELGSVQFIVDLLSRQMPREEFFERFFDHGRGLLDMCDRSPEGALSYLQILDVLGGGRVIEEFFARRMPAQEFFVRFFHPRQLLELGERKPEAALAFLQILRDLGGGRALKEVFDWHPQAGEFFERFFHPRQLLELTARKPEAALAFLQILRDQGGERVLKKFFDRRMPAYEFFERILSDASLTRTAARPEASLAISLSLTKMCNSSRVTEPFTDSVSRRIRSGALGDSLLALLPVSAISDLRWIAVRTEAPEIKQLLQKLEFLVHKSRKVE